LWGFEIEHQANFSYLPGLLKNIVLNYTFTFLRSEAWTLIKPTTSQNLIEYQKQPMDNVPDFFANIILGYDIMGFSFRLSYFYQDKYLITYDYSSDKIFENKFSRIDVAASQKILGNIVIILNLNNVTDFQEEASYEKVYGYGNSSPIAQKYRTGMNVSLGIRIGL
jgi:hypothetical protein